MQHHVIEKKGLYKIVLFNPLRKTRGVLFDNIPAGIVTRINAIDRVIHKRGAQSPGPVGIVKRPWYMHPHQADNLIVLHGVRHIEIYIPQYKAVEKFTVYPDKLYHNGTLVCTQPAMLVWPRGVFHRIVSGKEGSSSINLAIHYKGFDIKTNFNIYDLDAETGVYRCIRKGTKDQPGDQ
jgi:hypothetical protein